jgi:hypothetical protein
MALIADQVNSMEKKEEHFLTVTEHETAMLKSGFEEFRLVLSAGDLVMFAARR